ncbi:LysE family translocator [Azospirillum humicireducens]|uniref:LysE family translocator n=1 Tax=Azospirillum humicireducens TaxID=1226968 RepID=A0A161JGU1_9PROT|nr:LysE family translocator [Azospirillum humicireducens]ANC90797.1 LysE family translocator [Azospirillum humicireducens]
MSPEFLVTSLIVVASPGTGVLLTLAAGLSQGARASAITAFGCTLGIVPHMAAAVLGLAALLHTSAVAFQGLKILGVLYLLYMAWATLKEQGALNVEAEAARLPAGRMILRAVLVNVLNPKLSIFFLAFLPQFVTDADPQPLARMLELSGVFMALTFVVFVVYGLFAAAVRDQVVSRPRVMAWMRRSFAAAFAALGAKLALAER